MEDFDRIDPNYLKGFNDGYRLAQHRPELAQLLANVDSDLSRIMGLKAGVDQYQTDQLHVQQVQPDVFDQLLDKQQQFEKDWNRMLPDPVPDQPQNTDKNVFDQLVEKQQKGHDGHTLEP